MVSTHLSAWVRVRVRVRVCEREKFHEIDRRWRSSSSTQMIIADYKEK